MTSAINLVWYGLVWFGLGWFSVIRDQEFEYARTSENFNDKALAQAVDHWYVQVLQ
jgi:hypothetical protein